MVKRVYRPEICAYLRRNGIASGDAVHDILTGFDFHYPSICSHFRGVNLSSIRPNNLIEPARIGSGRLVLSRGS
jgi:hypothetical protein